MTKLQKFLACIIMPFCFVWFVLSFYYFYTDVLAWQRLEAGYTFYDAAIELGERNILTLIGLRIVYKWSI